MAYYDTTWYCNFGNGTSTGYYAVTPWAATTAVVAGALRRQLAVPTVNSERVFVCIVAGTTGSTEPTWVLTRGAKTTDGTVTWMECTGIAAVNGDITNTVNWTAAKAIGTPSLGTIIQRNNGASYQICTTAGTLGASEPAFSDTAGVTTPETSATTVWTSLGVVGNFTGGQAPHARLQNACAVNWFVGGNTIYVGDNHAESQSTSISMSPVGTPATVSKVLCHNHSGSYPPAVGNLATGASITSTVSVGSLTFSPSPGSFYLYGVTFNAGNSSSTLCALVLSGTAAVWTYYDNCSFRLGATGANSNNLLQLASNSANTCIFNNTTVSFGNVVQYIDLQTVNFIWRNTGQILVSGSAIPNNLLQASGSGHLCSVSLEALDLSQLTGSLTANASASVEIGNFLVKDCKLNVSMTITQPVFAEQNIQLVRCDSSATAYKSARYQYEGTETTEISITRVGGASDPTGQAQSRKIVTTANSQWLRPFKAEPYAIWNAVTGANVTVTVCGTVNAGALPNNDDIWMDVEYLGSSATPLGTIVNTTKANLLAANAAVASDGSSWNNATTGSPSTWNSSDKSSITLSGSNLIATATAIGGVRAVLGKTSGKYYFEFTLNTFGNGNSAIGIANASAPLATLGPGSGVNACVVYTGGNVYVNGSSSSRNIGTGVGSGALVCVALDLNTYQIWMRVGASGNWFNSPANDPAAGTGGLSISSIASSSIAAFPAFGPGASGEIVTANFGGSTFSGAVPSGYASGWFDAWSAFKLTTTLSAPSPGFAGYLEARVRAAKPNATYYLDPKIVLS